MHKIFLLFVISFLGFSATAQVARISGRVVANDSLSTPLEGTHIVSKGTGRATVAGQNGQFELAVPSGDTLYFSYVGFKTLAFAVAEKTTASLIIRLSPADEQLREIVVEGLPSERVLKNRILALELPEEESVELELPAWTNQEINPNGVSLVSVGGVVSGLANKFNKKEQGRIFKANMARLKSEDAIINYKLNDSIIKKATGITNDELLAAFKAYCEMPRNFILEASEYEIHKAIAECFAAFEKQQKASKG